MACLTGAIACLPFVPALVDELGAAQPVSIGWMVYLGLFPTAIGFTTWAYALSRSSAGRLGSMTYLVPPVVIAMAWLVLGEVPPALAIAGGALCIVGVIVARSRGGLPWRPQPGGRRRAAPGRAVSSPALARGPGAVRGHVRHPAELGRDRLLERRHVEADRSRQRPAVAEPAPADADERPVRQAPRTQDGGEAEHLVDGQLVR